MNYLAWKNNMEMPKVSKAHHIDYWNPGTVDSHKSPRRVEHCHSSEVIDEILELFLSWIWSKTVASTVQGSQRRET